MKRMKVLFGNRRMMVLLTLAILVLTATALVASGASFTATSANPGNIFTAGNLKITTNPANGNAVAFTVAPGNMAPGDTVTGTATVTNTGSVSGRFSLKGAVNAGGGTTPYPATDNDFAANLLLTVTENGTPLVTNQPLTTALNIASLQTSGGATSWAAGATSTYTFAVTFKDNGVDVSGVGVDNRFMNKSATFDLSWSAVDD